MGDEWSESQKRHITRARIAKGLREKKKFKNRLKLNLKMQ
jgi:hypothetical protein